MKNLIVANWKMNPQSYAEAEAVARRVLRVATRLRGVETVLCPPFVWLECLADAYEGKAFFGGQDAFWEDRGAYTGEVSPRMLKNLGCRYVIIGHSERRRHLGETDEMVNKKVKAAMSAGLRVVLCVGETLAERRRDHTKAVLRWQLKKDLEGISKSKIQNPKLIIAYEPVWAIGTGLPETPENANAAAAFIRAEIRQDVRVLYGGSVNAKNIAQFLVMPHISGALVGGASLRQTEFAKILRIANAMRGA